MNEFAETEDKIIPTIEEPFERKVVMRNRDIYNDFAKRIAQDIEDYSPSLNYPVHWQLKKTLVQKSDRIEIS